MRAPSREVAPPRPRPGPASGAPPPPFPRALFCAAAPGGPAPPRSRGDAQAEPWEGPGRSPPPQTAGRPGSAQPPRPPRPGWPWAGGLGGPPGEDRGLCSLARPRRVPSPWSAALLRQRSTPLAPASWGSGGSRHVRFGEVGGGGCGLILDKTPTVASPIGIHNKWNVCVWQGSGVRPVRSGCRPQRDC